MAFLEFIFEGFSGILHRDSSAGFGKSLSDPPWDETDGKIHGHHTQVGIVSGAMNMEILKNLFSFQGFQ